MSVYKVSWLENKVTSTGKSKADATLIDPNETIIEGVTIWGDFPKFAELRPGVSVEGDVVIKQNGKYTNKSLYAPKTNTLRNPSAPAWATAKPTGIKAAQERKAEGIEKSFDRKEEGIKVSSTMRDAVQIALMELGSNQDHVQYEERVLYWRKWLWIHWDDEQAPF